VREHMFARALGRVVAHELYHTIARTTAHSQTGLARPTLSPAELTESDISLRSVCRRVAPPRDGRQGLYRTLFRPEHVAIISQVC
jgi:hypothetical protein